MLNFHSAGLSGWAKNPNCKLGKILKHCKDSVSRFSVLLIYQSGVVLTVTGIVIRISLPIEVPLR